MGYLSKKRLYLSGPIEYGDMAINWRTAPKARLSTDFKIEIFDPFDDPKQQWVTTLYEAKNNKDYDVLADIAHRFVRKDLSLVDRSDFLIAYLPHLVVTTGTVHEIIISNNAKKPTLLICPEAKEKIPVWYFGFVPHRHMFGSWSDVYQYLQEVDDGEHKDDDRWSYVYGLI